MPKETEKCNNDCENCEYYEDWDDCDDIMDDESLVSMLFNVVANMSIEEFEPLIKGLVSMYATVHGWSIGKTMEAVFLGAYSDEDIHWDEEQAYRGMTS